MKLNKKVSEPNFIIYKAEDMPNKYVRKYYGKLPIIACVLKNAEEEERVKDLCDNFLFDSYTPSTLEKKSK